MSKSSAGWVVAVAACCTVAFLVLDPIVAAFVAILLVTGLVAAALARDWDRHPTYEQREQVRTQRRKEKWERGKEARERDRVRWEAHQARQAGKAAQAPREPGQ